MSSKTEKVSEKTVDESKKQEEYLHQLMKYKPSGFDPNVRSDYVEDGELRPGSWKDQKYEGQFIDHRNPWPNEIVIDIDEGDATERRSEVKRLLMVLHDLGVEPLATDTGGKGFHVHIFFEVPEGKTWKELRSYRLALYNYLKHRAEEGYNADVSTWDDGVVDFDLTKGQGHLIRAIGGRHRDTGHRKTRIGASNLPKKELEDLENVEYPHRIDYLRINQVDESDADITWKEINEKAEEIEEREKKKEKEKLESSYKSSKDGLDGLRQIPADEVLRAFYGIDAEPGDMVKCVVHDSEDNDNAKIMTGNESEKVEKGMYGCFGDSCCKSGETIHYHNAIDMLVDSEIKDLGFIEAKNKLSEEFNVELGEEHIDYKIENFTMPGEYFKQDDDGNWVEKDSTSKQDYTREFAEYLARELELVKTVKLDEEKNTKMIYKYDPLEKIWKKGGEDYAGEKFYQALPKKYSKRQNSELESIVHKIEPINLEDTKPNEPNVPVNNGVLDLDDLELRNIEKTDYFTSKLPVRFPGIDVEKPQKFIEFLNDSVRKEEDIRKIQEYLGYCLMSWTAKYEKALMLVGPTDSGKSVLLDVVRELLGEDNVAQESLKDISDTDWAIHNLVGSIANINHDLDADQIEKVGKAKQVISGDPQTAEEKYVQPYDYAPKQKHLYSANETPKVGDDEEAFYNRWITVVFPKTVPKTEQNKDLVDELTTEEELNKILAWAVRGQQRLEKQCKFSGENGPYKQKQLWQEFGDSVERFVSKFLVTKSQKIREMKTENKEEDAEVSEMNLRVSRKKVWQLYEKYAIGTDKDLRKKEALYDQIKQLTGVKPGKFTFSESRKRGFNNVELVENANKQIEEKIEEIQSAKSV